MSVKLRFSGLSDHDKKHIKTLTIACDNEDVGVFDVVKEEPSGSASVCTPAACGSSELPSLTVTKAITPATRTSADAQVKARTYLDEPELPTSLE